MRENVCQASTLTFRKKASSSVEVEVAVFFAFSFLAELRLSGSMYPLQALAYFSLYCNSVRKKK